MKSADSNENHLRRFAGKMIRRANTSLLPTVQSTDTKEREKVSSRLIAIDRDDREEEAKKLFLQHRKTEPDSRIAPFTFC